MAWKQGVKSLYYCRSKSMQRAEVVAMKEELPEELRELAASLAPAVARAVENAGEAVDYEECLACQ